MSSTRNFTFKSNTVQGVTSNSHTVASVMYDTTLVFGGEEEPAEAVFELLPEFVPTNTTIVEPTIKRNKTVYTIPNYYRLTGNSNFFVRANQHNTGEVTIAKTNGIYIHGYKIDNYGYGIFRNMGYNNWPGGDLRGNQDSTITFTPANDTALAKTFLFSSETDEDNTAFLRGLYLAKLIRIPASGISSYLIFLNFYSTFDIYDTSPDWTIYDCSVVGTKDEDNNVIKVSAKTVYSSAEIENNIFLDTFTVIKDAPHQRTVRFSVGENTTGAYRYNFISSGSQVHFIQEPRSNNRIYYGTIPNLPQFWEEYNDAVTDFTNHAYIFQLANSEIVTTSKVLTGATGSNNKNYRNVLCVPANTYSITTSDNSNPPIIASSYYWGDQEYIIYQMNGGVTYTVTAL